MVITPTDTCVIVTVTLFFALFLRIRHLQRICKRIEQTVEKHACQDVRISRLEDWALATQARLRSLVTLNKDSKSHLQDMMKQVEQLQSQTENIHNILANFACNVPCDSALEGGMKGEPSDK